MGKEPGSRLGAGNRSRSQIVGVEVGKKEPGSRSRAGESVQRPKSRRGVGAEGNNS